MIIPKLLIAGNGELQGVTSATLCPTLPCKLLKFKASNSNAGNVYIGKSGVTKVDGTTDTTTGYRLEPGDDSGWLPVANLNKFYRICDNAGDALTYIALA